MQHLTRPETVLNGDCTWKQQGKAVSQRVRQEVLLGLHVNAATQGWREAGGGPIAGSPELSKVCYKIFHCSPLPDPRLEPPEGLSEIAQSPASYSRPLSEAAAIPTGCSSSCPQFYTDTHLSECSHRLPACFACQTLFCDPSPAPCLPGGQATIA